MWGSRGGLKGDYWPANRPLCGGVPSSLERSTCLIVCAIVVVNRESKSGEQSASVGNQ